MRLDRLSLHRFRSYESAELELAPGLTALVGRNGQGKTNVIEAIAYLAIMGLGLGAYLTQVDGVSYIEFIAPGKQTRPETGVGAEMTQQIIEIDQISHRNFRGIRFSEILHMRRGNRLWAQFEEVAEARKPIWSEVPYVGADPFIRRIRHCLMPLGADGETVDMIFTVLDIERSSVAAA